MKKKRSESSGTWAGGYQHWEWPPPSPPAPIRTGGFASRPPPPPHQGGKRRVTGEVGSCCHRREGWGGGGWGDAVTGRGVMRLSPCHRPGGKSAPQDEVDEIEVYGSEAQSGTQLATYSFEVPLRGDTPTPPIPRSLPVSPPPRVLVPLVPSPPGLRQHPQHRPLRQRRHGGTGVPFGGGESRRGTGSPRALPAPACGPGAGRGGW